MLARSWSTLPRTVPNLDLIRRIVTNVDGHKKENQSNSKEVNHQMSVDLDTLCHNRLDDNLLSDRELKEDFDNQQLTSYTKFYPQSKPSPAKFKANFPSRNKNTNSLASCNDTDAVEGADIFPPDYVIVPTAAGISSGAQPTSAFAAPKKLPFATHLFQSSENKPSAIELAKQSLAYAIWWHETTCEMVHFAQEGIRSAYHHLHASSKMAEMAREHLASISITESEAGSSLSVIEAAEQSLVYALSWHETTSEMVHFGQEGLRSAHHQRIASMIMVEKAQEHLASINTCESEDWTVLDPIPLTRLTNRQTGHV
eukprot:scaffold377563_cov96-Cyclotella_meneghiniana.AAC.2